MPVFDPFFKRIQRERGEVPTVFQTESMPIRLVLQLKRIFSEIVLLGSTDAMKAIMLVMQREAPEAFPEGLYTEQFLSLVFSPKQRSQMQDLYTLSAIELAYQLAAHSQGAGDHRVKELLEELNIRMRENGYGYQMEEGHIVPMDSTVTHSEAVKPVIALMHSAVFQGALDEFMEAFTAYKQQNYEETIRLCANAVESTLKQIITERGWPMPAKQTAAPLFDVLVDQGLLPAYLTTHYTSLFSMLKSGAPTVRNNSGGHGQGTEVRQVPDYLARFVINMTASSILFLIHAHQDRTS